MTYNCVGVVMTTTLIHTDSGNMPTEPGDNVNILCNTLWVNTQVLIYIHDTDDDSMHGSS